MLRGFETYPGIRACNDDGLAREIGIIWDLWLLLLATAHADNVAKVYHLLCLWC